MGQARAARRRYTIVGIDPGTKIGLAVIDLDGKLVKVFSAKNYPISAAIAWIISCGRPLIVASDVYPTPAMVRKIGSILAAHVHDLTKSLSTEEKIALAKGEGYEYKNAHERDALAACINTFNYYEKKFLNVQKKTPAGIDLEEVKALLVKGLSISAAINRLIRANEERKRRESTVTVPKVEVAASQAQEEKKGSEKSESNDKDKIKLRELLRIKDTKIEMLEELMKSRDASLKEKEREVRSLNRKLSSIRSATTREIRRAEEIRKRETVIERLREEVRAKTEENRGLMRIIEGLKVMKKRKVNGEKRIKTVPSFSHAAIMEIDEKYGLNKGDIIFFEDGSGGGASTAELLAKKGVIAVLYGKALSHCAANTLSELGIPGFSIDEIPLLSERGSEASDAGSYEERDFEIIDGYILNEKIEEWRRRKISRKRVILQR